MEFVHVPLGRARIVPGDQHDGPGEVIEPPNWIYMVKLGDGLSSGAVIGAVQRNPCVPNEWRAVAATRDGRLPKIDFRQGLWSLTPGRSGFRTRKEACVWLLGVRDARSVWFDEAEREG